jgi:hypothetical protein
MAENKIEQFLIDLLYTYQQVEQNLWLIDDEEHGLSGVAVALTDSLVTFRVVVMDDPKTNSLELYTRLLELNADLIHGGYALSGGKVLLLNTLEYDTMDYGDFRAVLDAFSLALSQHYPVLSQFRVKPEQAGNN